jgi:hypothetical protein
MSLARILGYIILAFYLLAATNSLKRYTKNKAVRFIASNHQIFGIAAGVTALVHFIVNLSNGNTNPLGLLTLLTLFATGALGTAFKKTKNKKLYLAHRIVGPLVLVFALLHIFL